MPVQHSGHWRRVAYFVAQCHCFSHDLIGGHHVIEQPLGCVACSKDATCQNAMTSSQGRTSAESKEQRAAGYRAERSLMDCVVPPLDSVLEQMLGWKGVTELSDTHTLACQDQFHCFLVPHATF